MRIIISRQEDKQKAGREDGGSEQLADAGGRSGGTRATVQKAAIVAAINASDDALSAQELHARLDDVGLATVYRNLARLAEGGEIDAILRPNGETAYRACSREHHHHLICRECGRVVEIHDCDLGEWGRKIGAEFGFSGVEHHAELIGTCDSCASR